MKPRDQVVRLRCTKDEQRQVSELADADGTTVSDYLRTFIRQQHAKRFGAPTPPKRKARTSN